MNNLLVTATASLLLATGASAQVMGGVNMSAPKVSSSISFKSGGMVQLEYTSITWAQGQWTNMLQSEQGRMRINNVADKKPIGELTVDGATIMFGGKSLEPGKYHFKFNVNDDKKWVLVIDAEDGDTKHEWVLPLEEKKAKSDRLRLTIEAGDADTGLECAIAFGQKACTVTGKKAPKKEG